MRCTCSCLSSCRPSCCRSSRPTRPRGATSGSIFSIPRANTGTTFCRAGSSTGRTPPRAPSSTDIRFLPTTAGRPAPTSTESGDSRPRPTRLRAFRNSACPRSSMRTPSVVCRREPVGSCRRTSSRDMRDGIRRSVPTWPLPTTATTSSGTAPIFSPACRTRSLTLMRISRRREEARRSVARTTARSASCARPRPRASSRRLPTGCTRSLRPIPDSVPTTCSS